MPYHAKMGCTALYRTCCVEVIKKLKKVAAKK